MTPVRDALLRLRLDGNLPFKLRKHTRRNGFRELGVVETTVRTARHTFCCVASSSPSFVICSAEAVLRSTASGAAAFLTAPVAASFVASFAASPAASFVASLAAFFATRPL